MLGIIVTVVVLLAGVAFTIASCVKLFLLSGKSKKMGDVRCARCGHVGLLRWWKSYSLTCAECGTNRWK
ncbi:MAG: hypothetical protein JWQ98_1227 [Chlorobi bacterium]|nr:hypothetical protein [Chlorobiota bacterium]